MNIDYISGFFDGDGSTTLCKGKTENLYRHPMISFCNTQLDILLQIKKFLKEKYNLTGYLSTKPPMKKTHITSYSLAYSYRPAIDLLAILKSRHKKKMHRINTVLKYYDEVTNRGGHYSSKDHMRKIAFERLYFWIK